MSSTQIKLYFFAKSKDLTGLNEAVMVLGESSLTGNDLLVLIIDEYPKYEFEKQINFRSKI